jgi:membrane associated rhomboid family serine protease
VLPIGDENPTRRVPIVTIVLIVANVAVFFLWQIQVGMERSVALAALVPAELRPVSVPGVEHLFTSMFMHGSLFHLAGNMWFLWIFGDNVEDELGRIRFIVFYFLCGLAAALAHVVFHSNSSVPVVGASGAISGVLGAYLVLHPRAQVKMLSRVGVVRMPAWGYLFVWIGMQVLSQSLAAGRAGTGVAYLAHIGGFVAGVVLSLIVIPRKNPVDF